MGALSCDIARSEISKVGLLKTLDISVDKFLRNDKSPIFHFEFKK